MPISRVALRWLKPLLFVLCLLPLAGLVWDGLHALLGANPVEKITHTTGDWALRLLLLTLAISPLRHLTGWHWLASIRRMLGLFTFFYVCLHLSTYLVFDHFFDWQDIARDVVKRPYITLGFMAFVLLFPLALTSSNGMMKRLGRRWRTLHQAVYPAAVLGILHYFWLVKADYRLPAVYGIILMILLGYRAWRRS